MEEKLHIAPPRQRIWRIEKRKAASAMYVQDENDEEKNVPTLVPYKPMQLAYDTDTQNSATPLWQLFSAVISYIFVEEIEEPAEAENEKGKGKEESLGGGVAEGEGDKDKDKEEVEAQKLREAEKKRKKEALEAELLLFFHYFDHKTGISKYFGCRSFPPSMYLTAIVAYLNASFLPLLYRSLPVLGASAATAAGGAPPPSSSTAAFSSSSHPSSSPGPASYLSTVSSSSPPPLVASPSPPPPLPPFLSITPSALLLFLYDNTGRRVWTQLEFDGEEGTAGIEKEDEQGNKTETLAEESQMAASSRKASSFVIQHKHPLTAIVRPKSVFYTYTSWVLRNGHYVQESPELYIKLQSGMQIIFQLSPYYLARLQQYKTLLAGPSGSAGTRLARVLLRGLTWKAVVGPVLGPDGKEEEEEEDGGGEERAENKQDGTGAGEGERAQKSVAQQMAEEDMLEVDAEGNIWKATVIQSLRENRIRILLKPKKKNEENKTSSSPTAAATLSTVAPNTPASSSSSSSSSSSGPSADGLAGDGFPTEDREAVIYMDATHSTKELYALAWEALGITPRRVLLTPWEYNEYTAKTPLEYTDLCVAESMCEAQYNYTDIRVPAVHPYFLHYTLLSEDVDEYLSKAHLPFDFFNKHGEKVANYLIPFPKDEITVARGIQALLALLKEKPPTLQPGLRRPVLSKALVEKEREAWYKKITERKEEETKERAKKEKEEKEKKEKEAEDLKKQEEAEDLKKQEEAEGLKKQERESQMASEAFENEISNLMGGMGMGMEKEDEREVPTVLDGAAARTTTAVATATATEEGRAEAAPEGEGNAAPTTARAGVEEVAGVEKAKKVLCRRYYVDDNTHKVVEEIEFEEDPAEKAAREEKKRAEEEARKREIAKKKAQRAEEDERYEEDEVEGKEKGEEGEGKKYDYSTVPIRFAYFANFFAVESYVGFGNEKIDTDSIRMSRAHRFEEVPDDQMVIDTEHGEKLIPVFFTESVYNPAAQYNYLTIEREENSFFFKLVRGESVAEVKERLKRYLSYFFRRMQMKRFVFYFRKDYSNFVNFDDYEGNEVGDEIFNDKEYCLMIYIPKNIPFPASKKAETPALDFVDDSIFEESIASAAAHARKNREKEKGIVIKT